MRSPRTSTIFVVLGIHTVFEHHAAMTPASLEAFLHEYRLTFRVAVDRALSRRARSHDDGGLRFHGTPSTVVIDRHGYIARQRFGPEDDLVNLCWATFSAAPSAPGRP